MSRKEPLPPRGERAAERRQRALRVIARLTEAFPDARCALIHHSAWELLVATVLSAQCTDERVNRVTPSLFARFPDPGSMAAADVEEIEELVRSTGFFRQKARNLLATAQRVSSVYGGEVPHQMDELLTLPGVARKTANVVISNCFPEHAAGIAVDTHVQRTTRRLGLTRHYDPQDIERDLMRLVPRDRWNDVTHLLIDHGRAICKAPRPRCTECPVMRLCPSYERFVGRPAPAPNGA